MHTLSSGLTGTFHVRHAHPAPCPVSLHQSACKANSCLAFAPRRLKTVLTCGASTCARSRTKLQLQSTGPVETQNSALDTCRMALAMELSSRACRKWLIALHCSRSVLSMNKFQSRALCRILGGSSKAATDNDGTSINETASRSHLKKQTSAMWPVQAYRSTIGQSKRHRSPQTCRRT